MGHSEIAAIGVMEMRKSQDVADFWFVSFADSRLRKTHDRIVRQAEKMGVWGDRIVVFNENDLDDGFRQKMATRMRPGTRGFGYWCWKPQCVVQVLERMKDGDVLIYVDSGSHLNPKGVCRLLEYYQLAKKHGIVAFQARSLNVLDKNNLKAHFYREYEWTKGDLLDYFGVRQNEGVVRSGQFVANAFLVCKTDEAVALFRKYRDMFVDHFNLCDDTISTSQNIPGFISHRYDQSVFSLLAKTQGAYSLSNGEIEPIREMMPEGEDPRFYPDFLYEMNHCPIWAIRDKGEIRLWVPVFLRRLVRWWRRRNGK